MAGSIELQELRGEVVQVHCAYPHFSAGKLCPLNHHGEVSFAGKCFVRIGDLVRLRGTWRNDPKWGRQFQVDSLAFDECLDKDGLAAWLAKHAGIYGVGPVRARRIADAFGADFPRMVREDPEAIAIETGTPIDAVRQLGVSWFKHEEDNKIITKLSSFGLTKNQVDVLVEKFGASIIPLIESNPYMLLNEVDGIGFATVDGIARKTGVSKTAPCRLQAGVSEALRQQLQQGSTCQERDALLGGAEELLTLDDLSATAIIAAELDNLATDGKGLREVADDVERLYALAWPLRCEELIADSLRVATQPNPHFPDVAAVESLVRRHASALNDESQAAAVRMALTHRLCVITGAAGCGKSTVVKSIVSAYQERFRAAEDNELESVRDFVTDDDFDLDLGSLSPMPRTGPIALAAPTGKAARRLEQIVGLPASTIHRLLGYHPSLGFRCNDQQPLIADVAIVDEVSMLDSSLAFHLLRAIGPRTTVVLVGDHHQLPPVGFGSMLRDAIAHKLCPVTVLDKCHRQAGILKENCNAILRGHVERTAPKDLSAGYSPWIVHSGCETEEQVLAAVEKLYCEVLGDRYGFDLLRDVQFMTPKHAGPLGTKAVNVLLQRSHQRSLGVDVDPTSPDQRPRLYCGDKVIQTRNNYNLNVMNGHQGKVLAVRPMVVEFDGREVAIPHDCTGEIELAYCLTPHKCQGSEWPCVVTICHKSHSWMLHRQWFYTAATRAQKSSIIIGDPTGIRRAAERVEVDKRRTLLGVLAKKELLR